MSEVAAADCSGWCEGDGCGARRADARGALWHAAGALGEVAAVVENIAAAGAGAGSGSGGVACVSTAGAWAGAGAGSASSFFFRLGRAKPLRSSSTVSFRLVVSALRRRQ